MLNNISPHYIVLLMLAIAGLNGCTPTKQYRSYTADSHVSLGIAYLQQGNLEKARGALNEAISDQPFAPASWGAMAYLEELCGNTSLAEKYYQQAIQLAPSLGEGHNNYGIFLCRQGKPNEGIKEILTAAQSPSYIYQARAYQNAGLCALKIPNRQAAEKYFEIARQNGFANTTHHEKKR